MHGELKLTFDVIGEEMNVRVFSDKVNPVMMATALLSLKAELRKLDVDELELVAGFLGMSFNEFMTNVM